MQAVPLSIVILYKGFTAKGERSSTSITSGGDPRVCVVEHGDRIHNLPWNMVRVNRSNHDIFLGNVAWNLLRN